MKIPKVSSGDREYIAQWSTITYTISYTADEKIISGTPTEAGNFELEIIASAGGMSDSRFLTLTIKSADVELDTSGVILTGKVGKTYEAEIFATPETLMLPVNLQSRLGQSIGGGSEATENFTLTVSCDNEPKTPDIMPQSPDVGPVEPEEAIISISEDFSSIGRVNENYSWSVENLP